MLNGLDLFSGIGGMSCALKDYVRPIVYCEIDPFCQAVLLSRIADGNLGNAPIWNDVRSLDGKEFCNSIDIIYGGFPCQDISVAGNGKGLEGERSRLFFEIMRLSKEIQPRFLFLENVPAITTRGGLQVVREITEMGYDCRWCVISAASVGALHKRERWFLLAQTKSHRLQRQWRISGKSSKEQSFITMSRKDDSYSVCQPSKQTYSGTEPLDKRGESRGNNKSKYWPFESRDDWQKTVSEMGKCTDGVPFQVDRLKSLGNAVVPIQAKKAFEILMGINKCLNDF